MPLLVGGMCGTLAGNSGDQPRKETTNMKLQTIDEVIASLGSIGAAADLRQSFHDKDAKLSATTGWKILRAQANEKAAFDGFQIRVPEYGLTEVVRLAESVEAIGELLVTTVESIHRDYVKAQFMDGARSIGAEDFCLQTVASWYQAKRATVGLPTKAELGFAWQNWILPARLAELRAQHEGISDAALLVQYRAAIGNLHLAFLSLSGKGVSLSAGAASRLEGLLATNVEEFVAEGKELPESCSPIRLKLLVSQAGAIGADV